jgi:hypothetical protein
MGIVLAPFTLVMSWAWGQRSVGAGMAVVLTAGYFYGIARARIHDGFSHFLFDCAVLGCYLAYFARAGLRPPHAGLKALYQWAAVLVGWPCLVLVVGLLSPTHPLIQLVGLRAAVWFLPFLLVGARAGAGDLRVITRALALLNLAALAVGLGEYFLGIEAFLPENASTELIYVSKDIAGREYHRIPATFISAAAYGGVMVASWPFLAGRLAAPGIAGWEKLLLTAALAAAAVGVFLCGSRAPVVMLVALAAYTAYQLKSRLRYLALLAVLAAVVAHVVSGSERLQRFTTLEDTDAVSERIITSANVGLADLLLEHPLGTGLGSAWGTSIPSFLQHLAPPPYGAENEYVRIALEQGLVGTCLWLLFLLWFFTRGSGQVPAADGLTCRLARFYVLLSWGLACIGTGTLLSVPAACLMLFTTGWVARCACARPALALTRPGAGRRAARAAAVARPTPGGAR